MVICLYSLLQQLLCQLFAFISYTELFSYWYLDILQSLLKSVYDMDIKVFNLYMASHFQLMYNKPPRCFAPWRLARLAARRPSCAQADHDATVRPGARSKFAAANVASRLPFDFNNICYSYNIHVSSVRKR